MGGVCQECIYRCSVVGGLYPLDIPIPIPVPVAVAVAIDVEMAASVAVDVAVAMVVVEGDAKASRTWSLSAATKHSLAVQISSECASVLVVD